MNLWICVSYMAYIINAFTSVFVYFILVLLFFYALTRGLLFSIIYTLSIRNSLFAAADVEVIVISVVRIIHILLAGSIFYFFIANRSISFWPKTTKSHSFCFDIQHTYKRTQPIYNLHALYHVYLQFCRTIFICIVNWLLKLCNGICLSGYWWCFHCVACSFYRTLPVRMWIYTFFVLFSSSLFDSFYFSVLSIFLIFSVLFFSWLIIDFLSHPIPFRIKSINSNILRIFFVDKRHENGFWVCILVSFLFIFFQYVDGEKIV